MEASKKGDLFLRCHQALDRQGAGAERRSIFAPGRVEFLGKHTDYAGGRSLLCAVERGFCLTSAPRSDRTLTVRDVVNNLETSFSLDHPPEPRPGEWTTYVVAVARRVMANFPATRRGMDLVFGSDLPAAAGLSSSSALVTGSFVAFSRLNDLESTPEYQDWVNSPEDLAEYLGCIENGNAFRGLAGDRGVGTSGGSQDHTAILLSQAGSLVEYSFMPTRRESIVPFPEGHLLVIGVSGVAAEKTGAARVHYNHAAERVQEILRIWRAVSGGTDRSLVAAASAHADAHDQIRRAISQSPGDFDRGGLLGRFEQVMMESSVLIPDAVLALKVGDLRRLGEIVELSQLLAERLLDNQIPETIALVRQAQVLGAVASSAFGAGFGGSVYALVPEGEAGDFTDRWSQAYRKQFPQHERLSAFFASQAGPPLTVVGKQ